MQHPALPRTFVRELARWNRIASKASLAERMRIQRQRKPSIAFHC
jgi:predicted alpha/beta hydrolase